MKSHKEQKERSSEKKKFLHLNEETHKKFLLDKMLELRFAKTKMKKNPITWGWVYITLGEKVLDKEQKKKLIDILKWMGNNLEMPNLMASQFIITYGVING